VFNRRFGQGGPLGLVLGWLLRALGLGFVLGAAVGVRAARRGDGNAHEMAGRVERALKILRGQDGEDGGEEAADTPPAPGVGAPS
jgi:hypothetical protein